MRTLKISSKKPEIDKINEAARMIKDGGVVIFPTETVYGIGCDPFNRKAVERIYKLKGRSFKKPLAVLVSDLKQIAPLVKRVSKTAKRLIKKYMPGPVTFVFKKSRKIPSYVTARQGTIGVRMPDHPVALRLIRAFGMPLAATSANRSGWADTRGAKAALDQLKKADMVIDGGRARIGKASTVVDLTSPAPKILRHGSLKIDIK